MNSINVVGRLTRNPELRYTESNKAVMKLDIAINNGKDDVTFLPITIFGNQAENVNKYCTKGDMLGIEGIIKNHNWEDNKGNKHYDYTFIANRVEFLSSKGNSTTDTKKTENEPKNASDNTQIYADFGDSIEFDEDLGW